MLKRHGTPLMLVLVLALGLTACGEKTTQPEFKALKMFPQGKSFSGFTLTSHHGNAWDADAFKGTFSVVFFGFANCPDICPTTLLDMQKIDRQFKIKNLPSPRFIFISVDPDRDTPANLKQYINFFNPEFYALTGDAANIMSIATQLGVAYKVAEHEPGDLVYDVDHASALYVLNPAGERIGLFTAPHNIENITQDLMALMESA